MKRWATGLGLAVVASAAVLGSATSAQAAWADQLSQKQMITSWCSMHHYALGYGNWQDGYYCKQTGYSEVRQSASPGLMCQTVLGDSNVRFHIYPNTKDGACAYWY